MGNKGFPGPMPSPGFPQMFAKWSEPPLVYQQSGQLTANKVIVLGAPRRDGKIIDAYIALDNCGRDNSGVELSAEFDVKIGGTSIFTTKPKIRHLTGELATESKHTMTSGDGGVTVGVINSANAAYDAGAIIMGQVTVTRTATPATEMSNVAVVVVLNPD